MFGAGLAATAAGGLMSAFGSAAEGSAAADSYRYKAGMAFRAAQIARMNADRAIAQGTAENEAIGLAGGARMGKLKAAQSASGTDMSDPSSARVRGSLAMFTRMGELNAVNRAQMEAYNENLKAQGYETEAVNLNRSAQNAETAGKWGFAKSLLGGATSFAEKWYRGGEVGAY